MKTDFTISVHVDFGVTPGLCNLVSALFPERMKVSAPSEASEKQQVGDDTPPQVPAEPEPEPEHEQTVEAAQPATAAVTATVTTEDVRAAMHRARQRIEGEDYKDNPDSDGYKRYHKELTARFKSFAFALGADKPSTLPAEQRAAFIYECNELTLTPEGNIEDQLPF